MAPEEVTKLQQAIEQGDTTYLSNLPKNIDWISEIITAINGQLMYPIHYAIVNRQVKVVNLILQIDPLQIDQIDLQDNVPLHLAAKQEDATELLDTLYAAGDDVNRSIECLLGLETNKTALHVAAEAGISSNVQWLIAHGANVTSTYTYRKFQAIHLAVLHNHLDVIPDLCEADDGVLSARDSYGQSPMILATRSGNFQMIHLLETLGASIDEPTISPGSEFDGYTPIHWAAWEGNLGLFLYLKNTKGASWQAKAGSNQLHVIHIAAGAGSKDVVEHLLSCDPKLINMGDSSGKTPVYYAAEQERFEVVKFLLERVSRMTADLKALLQQLLDKRDYPNANLLFLHLNPMPQEITLVRYLFDGQQALDLLLQAPHLTRICLDNEGIRSLIDEAPCNIHGDHIDWYRMHQPSLPESNKKERRGSMFVRIDTRRGQAHVYKPKKLIGTGAEGKVRLFINSVDGSEIAVKALIQDLQIPNIYRKNYENFANNYLKFNKLLYPNDEFAAVFHMEYTTYNERWFYTNRILMDKVKSTNAWEYVKTIDNARLLAQLVLSIIVELLRIHQLGVLLGDFNPANIMVDYDNGKFFIRFLDLGTSYRFDDVSALFWKLKESDRKWIPPEVCNSSQPEVAPHASQNVYSLAYCLTLLFAQSKLGGQLYSTYPFIQTFVQQGLQIAPAARPELGVFFSQLQDAIHPSEPVRSTSLKSSISAYSESVIHGDTQSSVGAVEEMEQVAAIPSRSGNRYNFWRLRRRGGNVSEAQANNQCCILI